VGLKWVYGKKSEKSGAAGDMPPGEMGGMGM